MPQAKNFIALPTSGAGSLEYWRGQLAWAVDVRAAKLPAWRINAKAYQDTLTPPDPLGVRVNVEFEKTEAKRHQLFFRLPGLKLRPSPRTIRDSYPKDPVTGLPNMQGAPSKDLKRAVAVFREVLTHLIGPKAANSKALMDELLFDLLCPAGLGFAKVGYERHTSGTVPMTTGRMIDDPSFQQPPGAILGLVGAPQIPETVQAPNIVCERYYASRISPARAIVPAEFMLSDYNRADFLGHDFFVTAETARRNEWNTAAGADIQASDRSAVSQDDRIVELEQTGRRTGLIQCREVFYYPANIGLHDNPDKIRRLVFVGGKTDPVVHEDFRDQRFSPNGKWTGGLKTLPIKVLSLRYVSDTAYPPSDCQMTRRASDELAEFRTQQAKHRRKSVPRVAVNVDKFTDEKIKQKFVDGKHYDDIPVSGDPNNVAAQIGQPQMPPDNKFSEQQFKNDIDRAWAMISPVQEGSASTATEIAAMSQASANRLGGEREKTVAFWLMIVECFGALVQLYADREDYVEITGEDGAKQIEAWDKTTLPGEVLYEAVPDSSLPPDAAADRDLALNFHNLAANSPFIDGEQEMRELTETYGRDPDRLVKQPNPPPPEKPKINLAVNGKDLDPGAPQYQNVVNVLIAAGIPADQLANAAPHDPAANPIGPAPVIDRERLRMAEADNQDHRAGGLVGVGA